MVEHSLYSLYTVPPAASVRCRTDATETLPLGDHLQRDPGERRARVGQGFDDLEVVHAFAYVRRHLQLFRELARLPSEFGALFFRPGDRHRAADALEVPDRAVFMLEALVEPHVDIARAEPYRQQVVDPGNKQCPIDEINSGERACRQVGTRRMAAEKNAFGEIVANPLQRAAHLADHFGQGDGWQH